MFPIPLQFLSHTKRATTSIYITCKREGRGSKACLHVGYLGFYVGECPHVPKILMMDQSNGLEGFF